MRHEVKSVPTNPRRATHHIESSTRMQERIRRSGGKKNKRRVKIRKWGGGRLKKYLSRFFLHFFFNLMSQQGVGKAIVCVFVLPSGFGKVSVQAISCMHV